MIFEKIWDSQEAAIKPLITTIANEWLHDLEGFGSVPIATQIRIYAFLRYTIRTFERARIAHVEYMEGLLAEKINTTIEPFHIPVKIDPAMDPNTIRIESSNRVELRNVRPANKE